MKKEDILTFLYKESDAKQLQKMRRAGINTEHALGISVYRIRNISQTIEKNHELALELWKTMIHEAQMLATLIDEPNKVDEQQMEKWVLDFNSWDLCDHCCSNLFDKTDYAYQKAMEWSKREEEFVKRAGFALMAALSVHDKNTKDNCFEQFFDPIYQNSTDERNYVKKAVNWALRSIGKKNINLNKKAIKVAREIQTIDNKTAHWIAKDALKELTSEKVKKRIKNKPTM